MTSPESHCSELDSHADTCCVGQHCAILYEWPDRTVEVTPFLESLGTLKQAPIVTALLIYDDPSNGKPLFLIFHQVVFIEDLEHNLLCPMQLRHAGLIINDRPKHCSPNPTREDHSIILPNDFNIPLDLIGVTSFFPTRQPTQDECQLLCQDGPSDVGLLSTLTSYVEMTAASPEWDPHSPRFANMVEHMVNAEGDVVDQADKIRLFVLAQTKLTEVDYSNPLLHFVKIYGARSKRRAGPWNENLLAKAWSISRDLAARTLCKTTRRGVRNFDEGLRSVERRYPTGDRPLRYCRLNSALYHDTMFSAVKSIRGNKCSEIYVTDFCWARSFPIIKESDVHHTLDELFHRHGVPESLVSDGAKALTQGEFARKARQANCPIDVTDPYSPWQNAAEVEKTSA